MENNVKIDKAPRAVKTRDVEARKTVWSPPRQLDTPEPPEGFKYRWLRAEVRGMPDDKNITSRLREGYELVREDELSAEDKMKYPAMAEGKYKGVIGVGGLLLAKIPLEMAKARNDYFYKKSKEAQEAIDNEVLKDEHPSMPISKNRSSKVTFGGNQ